MNFRVFHNQKDTPRILPTYYFHDFCLKWPFSGWKFKIIKIPEIQLNFRLVLTKNLQDKKSFECQKTNNQRLNLSGKSSCRFILSIRRSYYCNRVISQSKYTGPYAAYNMQIIFYRTNNTVLSICIAGHRIPTSSMMTLIEISWTWIPSSSEFYERL